MEHGSFNLCSLPPWAIASLHFNENPQPLEIQGVREANRFFFEKLDCVESAEERGRIFDDWVSVRFQLHQWARETPGAGKSIKNSYLRFLRGWGVDSSSIDGAVLKGWAESRLGLRPTFHHGRIEGVESDAYARYALDRMKGSARTNSILSQLDLLNAFCQYELARRFPGERWKTLYRGVHEADDHEIVERLPERELVVRTNCLSSFTDDVERAWEFGTTVWEAKVPLAKVFFWSDLLPRSILQGEREWIVIGGELKVRPVLC